MEKNLHKKSFFPVRYQGERVHPSIRVLAGAADFVYSVFGMAAIPLDVIGFVRSKASPNYRFDSISKECLGYAQACEYITLKGRVPTDSDLAIINLERDCE